MIPCVRDRRHNRDLVEAVTFARAETLDNLIGFADDHTTGRNNLRRYELTFFGLQISSMPTMHTLVKRSQRDAGLGQMGQIDLPNIAALRGVPDRQHRSPTAPAFEGHRITGAGRDRPAIAALNR